jgi:hypothetical protein
MSDQSEEIEMPISLEFTEKELKFCDVEFVDSGEDVVYHFWPSKGDMDFPPSFAVCLESAFKAVLPTSADVRAEYTSRDEATAFMRYGSDPSSDSDPVPTYYVRVVGWAGNPMSDRFLKDKIFRELDQALSEVLQ